MKKDIAEKISRASDGILAIAGVYAAPQSNARAAGNSKTGAAVFVADSVANSSDIRAGAALAHALAAFITPFGVLTKKETEKLDEFTTKSSNPKLYAVLDKLHQERKGADFGATLIKAIGVPTSHALAVVTSLKLYDHWGVMSPAQKSLALAAMAIQIHKTDAGGAICDLVIVFGCGLTFTVKDALEMLQAGKNPYPFVAAFDQIYRLVKVFNESPTIEGMMDFATSHNLLGKGVNDGAVPGVSKEGIQRAGAKPAPQYGVGALATPRGSKTPDGYTDAAQMPGGNVIVPQANGATAVGALEGSLVGTKAGAGGISGDAAGVYAKWKPTDAKSQAKGSEGGSALIAGLSALKQSNTYLYSALVAFLAKYAHHKISIDNAGQYISTLAGIALARVVAGKSEAVADNEGAALAQSVHASTPADYAKLQINIRAMYATFGVSSKADAYQLSNQAYSEGRISESDLVAMHQIYDVVYNANSLGYVTKLLQGKNKGLEVAKYDCNFKNKMQEKGVIHSLPASSATDMRARNKAKFAKPQQDNSQEEAQEAPESAPQEGTENETPAVEDASASV